SEKRGSENAESIVCPERSRPGMCSIGTMATSVLVRFRSLGGDRCSMLCLPIPAVPTLIVCGALAAEGRISAAAVLGLAFLTSLIGDSLRFIAGRFYGRRVL